MVPGSDGMSAIGPGPIRACMLRGILLGDEAGMGVSTLCGESIV